MPAIADIGQTLTVTPQDDVWVASGSEDTEYIRDFGPFQMSVDEILRENGEIISVSGPVVGGAERYQGLRATLLVRLDGSAWQTDSTTQANFKVGPLTVTRVPGYPNWHPSGTAIAGYPVMGRFGRVDVQEAEQAS